MDMESLLKLIDKQENNNTDLDKECNTEESQGLTQSQEEEKVSSQPAFFEESPSTSATPNEDLLKQNTIHVGPLPYPEAPKQQQVKTEGV